MNYTEALTRLRQCRELQPDELTLTVSADIVDALLDPLPGKPHCLYCGQEEGHSKRCSVTKFGVKELYG